MTTFLDEIVTELQAPHAITNTAVSVDNIWRYTSTVRGMFRSGGRPLTAQWAIEHIPTGAQAGFARSLTGATRSTADGSALAGVEFLADREATGVYGPALVARGQVKLQILAGTILPAGPVDSRCECGGYLIRQAGTWLHVDVCPEEVHDSTAPCPDNRATHLFCNRAEAVQCEHPKCIRANDVHALPCQVGHENCCGCCGAA